MSVKYKTKNINTDCNDDFLVTINQISAKVNSRRNLRLTATRLCKVWLSGGLVCPLKKIASVINAIIEKRDVKMVRSTREYLMIADITRNEPAPINRVLINNRNKKYFIRGFNYYGYLIKSFTAV